MDDLKTKGHSIVLIGKYRCKLLCEYSGKKYSLPFLGDADLITLFSILFILIYERPDVIHTHSHHDHWLGGLAAKILNIPVVHTRHVAYSMKPTLLRRIMFSSLADVIITVSEYTRQQLLNTFKTIRSFDNSKVITVPSYSVTKQKAVQGLLRHEIMCPSKKIIACIGRFVEGKGQSYLIDILPELIKKHSDVCVVFAGDGPLKDDLEYRCRKEGLPVYFLGFRSDLQTIFADSYLSVVPSDFESLSFAAMDSLYHTVPVVASDVGGIPEVVENGKTGILFPSGDKKEFITAIDTLLTDTQLYDRMKKACSIVKRKIDEADGNNAVIAVYKKALEKKK